MLESVSPSNCQCSPLSQKVHWKHSGWLNLKILPCISHHKSTAVMNHFLKKKKKTEISVNFETTLSYKTYSNQDRVPFQGMNLHLHCRKSAVALKLKNSSSRRHFIQNKFYRTCINVTVKHKLPDECKTKTCTEISGEIHGWPFKHVHYSYWRWLQLSLEGFLPPKHFIWVCYSKIL